MEEKKEIEIDDVECGVQWTEVNRRDELVRKQKIFSSLKARERFCNKLEKKDNFIRFDAWG